MYSIEPTWYLYHGVIQKVHVYNISYSYLVWYRTLNSF